MTGTGPGRIRIEPATREQADALADSDAEFTRRFAVPAEADWAGFPEAVAIIVAATREGGSGPWGPHLFFGEPAHLEEARLELLELVLKMPSVGFGSGHYPNLPVT